MKTSTPTLDAVSESLLAALDDGPGSSDLTPPAGAVLAALGSKCRSRPSGRVRDKSNPWVCSVLFEGETESQFLVGNNSFFSETPLKFTKDPTEAMSGETANWFSLGWPYLIWSHGCAIGKKVRAVVHRLKDKPKF